jgi:hypothetical protein
LKVAATPEHRQAIVKHLKMVERAAGSVAEPQDRDDLLRVVAAALAGNDGKAFIGRSSQRQSGVRPSSWAS